MTNKVAAEKYQALALKAAEAYQVLEDQHDTADFLREQTHDNGDPEYALKESLWWLGKAVANALTYADEYRQDAEKGIEEANIGGTAES